MILFDGCSVTYGDELENPIKERFSSQIEKEHVNLSYCGKSNDGILRSTINYCEKNPVSHAVIQFTIYSRREFFREDIDKYYNISAQREDPISKIYFKEIQNVHDDVANYHKNKFLLENYFKNKNIKYTFISLQITKHVSQHQNFDQIFHPCGLEVLILNHTLLLALCHFLILYHIQFHPLSFQEVFLLLFVLLI